MHQTLVRILLVIVLGVAIAGCSTTRKTLNFDTSAKLYFSVAEDVNPDLDDRPSPVVVRLFKLVDERQFKRESFLTLYEDAPARLGKDLLGSVRLKEFTPGEERVEKIELTPETQYLGLMAEFSRYEDAESLLVVPIKDHKTNRIRILVNRQSLQLEQ